MSPIDLPPPVPGDPAGMRGLAGEIRRAAGRIGLLDDQVSGAVRAMVFEGKAARELEQRTDALHSGLQGAATGLQDLAGRVERKADEVEAAQIARERAIQQLLAEQRAANLEALT
jgi:uncharacterized protein YukE